MMKIKRLVIGLLPLISSTALADISSTNYSISAGDFSGGSAVSITSANYETAEGAIGNFSGDSVSSANYEVEAAAGINGPKSGLIPFIDSISPANYATYLDDESASFTVNTTDPDGDTLNYKALEGVTVKDGPQTANPLTWSLGASAIGRHEVTFEVIDPQDGSVVQDQSYYVYRKPIK